MDALKGQLEQAKQAMFGTPAEQGQEVRPDGGPLTGTAHKTSEVSQTGTGVVGSLGEAGHRMQEQQGADHKGYYDAQGKLTSALERGKEKLEGGSSS